MACVRCFPIVPHLNAIIHEGQDVKLNYISRGTGLEEHGINNPNIIYWTPPTPVLYEQIMQHREGLITHLGPMAVKTGHYTGRAPNDKFIVDEPGCHDKIWWGSVNRPIDPQIFDNLHKRLLKFHSV